MASQNGNREFVEGWILAQTLGEGAYGEVKLLLNRQTGETVAMKMVDLKKHPDASNSVKKEVCIQKILQNPHILRYFGKRTQADIEYIFLEYAAGGELFDRIEPDIGMSQHDAQRYFNQLISGVQYLHSRGVAHRDLKPENLLLDEHDNIKISDFGMATMFRLKGKERLLDKRCGTLPYVAPEVLTRPYSATPADIWSCGVILVAMLAGELPWDQPSIGCTEYVTWKSNERWTTTTPWSKINTLALSFLRKLLEPNSTKRILLDKIIEHKWCHLQFHSSSDTTAHINQDVVDSITNSAVSPKSKRQRSSEDIFNPMDDSASRNYQSQPMPQMLHVGELVSDILQNNEARYGFCFSQPAMMDDLILCTQLNPTQSASQNQFQKLVRRMTRFFVSLGFDDSIKRLSVAIEKLGYTCRISDNGMVTISTIDRRKLHLVFKANVVEMDGKILLDFRLSKGCGLEFKRRFVKIKHLLADIVVKGQ